MSSPLLVETLPDGTKEWLHYDEADERFILQREGDVEAVIKYCRERQNDGTNGYGKTREWRHIAEVPNLILLKWMNEDGVDVFRLKGKELSKFIKRKLNDPDWHAFRTVSGRI